MHVPQIACVNAIGAGDVCTGVFLHALVAATRADSGEQQDVELPPPASAAADAFAWGLAAACARCMHREPVFTREEVTELRNRIRIEAVVP